MKTNERKASRFLFPAINGVLLQLGRPPLGHVLLSIVVICLFLIFFLDRPIIIWMANQPDHFILPYFKMITRFGDATFWFIALIIGVFGCKILPRLEKFSHLRTQLTHHAWNFWFIILSCVVSGILHHFLKILIGRYRPRYLLSDSLYGMDPINFHIAQNSFPSGHSQTIFSICLAISLAYPRFIVICITLAILVSLSRVILLAHYPSDALFGAYLGICAAILLKRHYRDKKIQVS